MLFAPAAGAELMTGNSEVIPQLAITALALIEFMRRKAD
jgi:hypothetical protein